MSVLLQIVYINDIVVPIAAILCNVLLLVLIKTIKTKKLSDINYCFVPNSIIDIINSLVTFIAAPHVFQINGNICFIIGGLFASSDSFNKIFAAYMAALFSGLIITSMVSITISFYVRYLVICKHLTASFQTIILPYLILCIIFLISYFLLLWFHLFSNDFSVKIEGSAIDSLWIEEFGRPPLFVANKIFSTSFICSCGFLLITIGIQYTLIYYYSTQISTTLKTHIESNNAVTKILHKQIQRTLFIQAFGPAVIGSLPVIVIIFKSFCQLTSDEIDLFLSLFFPWVSMCNPLAALFMIKPYRNNLKIVMLKCFVKPFKKYGKISKILPSQTTTK